MKKTKFSSKDLGMVLFLVVFLIAVLYYMGFYKPLQQELASLATQSSQVDSEIDIAMQKAAKMQEMQAELEEILSRPKSEITEIAPYDNKEVVLNMLNGILSRTADYSLSFTDPQVQGDGTVRRNISMSFSCADYASAKAVIKDLTKSNWRCLVRNCDIKANRSYLSDDVAAADFNDLQDDMMSQPVDVIATITFFESTNLSK